MKVGKTFNRGDYICYSVIGIWLVRPDGLIIGVVVFDGSTSVMISSDVLPSFDRTYERFNADICFKFETLPSERMLAILAREFYRLYFMIFWALDS